MKRGLEIFHYLNADVPVGTSVHGVVDWPTRSWNMRRHSAEHLLTGLIEAIGKPPKVFSDLEKLEYQPSNLTAEQVAAVGRRFDEIVAGGCAGPRLLRGPRQDRRLGGPAEDQLPAEDTEERGETAHCGHRELRLDFLLRHTREEHPGDWDLAELRLEDAKKGKKIVYFKLAP